MRSLIDLRSELMALASKQHGLVSRQDMAALGIRPHQRRRLVADHTLEPAGPRAFRICGAPRTAEQMVLAACMDSVGVASHRTAAWLHGLGGFSGRVRPEVLADRRRNEYRRTEYRLHTTTWLPQSDVVEVRGIPCTNVARTLLGLSALSPREVAFDRVRGTVDEAIRDGHAQAPWLWWHLERVRCRGRGGVATLESILDLRADGAVTESWLEREFLRLLEGAGIPVPTCQARIDSRGSFVARVDFLYEPVRLVVEVSGYRHHSTRDQMSADARRRADLVAAGYTVLEFSYDQIVKEPGYVVERVRSSLADRTAA